MVFSFRSLDGPVSFTGWFSNPWLLAALSAMTGLQVTAVYAPDLQAILHTVSLSAAHWAIITLASLPLFIVPEIYKTMKERR